LGGKDPIQHLVPTPLSVGRNTFLWTRLLKAPSNLALNAAREGAATTSLGNLLIMWFKRQKKNKTKKTQKHITWHLSQS